MHRHKKRIGVVTLTIFLLMTFISGLGTVLASDKVPVSKGAIAKPAINRSGGGGGLSEELDREFNPNVSTDRPHLDDLRVRWGGGESWDIDLVNSNRSNECFATEHTITVPDEEIDVRFDPHRNDWSEWWIGDSSDKHRQSNDNERTISDIALEEGENIITIRVGDRDDVDVLTVTLTIICTVCTEDKPHLDSLTVDGVELIDEPGKKMAASHSITLDTDEVNIVFAPHQADWSDWWYGTDKPPGQGNQNRNSSSSPRTISDIALEEGENIITICVGDHRSREDRDVLTVRLTIIKTNVPVTGVTLNRNTLDLVVNGSGTLQATITPPNATNKNVTWSPSPAGVVTLTGSGLTRTVNAGSSAGTTTVTVTTADGNKTAACTVKVWNLRLDKSALEMTAGGNTRTIVATTEPGSKTVTWSSSNTSVATVSGGVVTPKSKGTATIKASIDVDGTEIEKTCTVNVRNPLALFVVGEPTLNPDGTYEATFGYESDYTGDTIGGLLTKNELSNATATLPAVFSKGKHTNVFTATYLHSKPAVWTVTYDGVTSTVTAGIEENPQISLEKAALNLVVNGASKVIAATISRPAGLFMTQGASSDIVWSIQSGGEYVSINGSGRACTVTPKSIHGTAVIKATFAGGVSATCTVKVWALSLTRPAGFFLTAGGDKKSLVAWQFPTNNYWPIKWESFNEAVAEIDEDTGVITPKKAGTTTIKATINVDGEELYMADGLRVYDPIDVFVSAPVLNDDGTYTATFGYTNHYDRDITIPWGFNNGVINGGFVFPPTTFKQGTVTDAFTVTYLHSKPASWSVKYDGVRDVAKAGKLPNDKIGISVIPALQLVAWGEADDLTARVEEVAIASFFGSLSDITWRVEQDSNVIKNYWHRGQTFTVYPHDPGTAHVTASFANGDSATCEVEVIDPRTISLSPQSLSLRVGGKSGQLVAKIQNDPRDSHLEARIADCFYPGLPYNWDIEWYTEQTSLIKLVPGEDGTCAVVPLKHGTAVVSAKLANGESASASVRIRSRNRPQEPEPVSETVTPPPPAPPAIETLDVTITVGNQVALVNGAEVTLDNNPLLIGLSRVMVDYADMAKLIPGLEVVWDWQTLSVVFRKDEKELKMVLDEIPADFDVPFMNIGGRLVVPVRYVGDFFGATVEWIGDTLVVHMYK